MKVTFTFEFKDLIEHIEKMLSMNGVAPKTDEDGGKQITFNVKKKEIVAHCEAIPVPDACPFCNSDVDQSTQTQQADKEETRNPQKPEGQARKEAGGTRRSPARRG